MVRSIFRKFRRLVPFSARVGWFRAKRTLSDRMTGGPLASVIPEKRRDAFSHAVFSHRARLVRDYPEPWYSLQQNKIVNLSLAASRIDGTLVRRGETFSFWRLVGRTSAKHGYLPGMTIADGHLTSAVGGGLCQLSNALYWASLHAGATILERHRHSFDCFPDSHRTVPFGAGATVFYNYIDFRFRNDGESDILIRTFLDGEYLNVRIFSDRQWSHGFRVKEQDHRYFTRHGVTYRENTLSRIVIAADGTEISREVIAHNEGKLLYDPGSTSHMEDTNGR